MKSCHRLAVVIVLAMLLGAIVACGPGPEEIAATANAAATATQLMLPTATPTPEPTADPAIVGESIFNKKFLETSGRQCHYCHKVNERDIGLIPLIGIATTAAERVEGMSAEEYLRQSILDPSAYVVEGFSSDRMPEVYGQLLSDEEVDALIAYLMTLK